MFGGMDTLLATGDAPGCVNIITLIQNTAFVHAEVVPAAYLASY